MDQMGGMSPAHGMSKPSIPAGPLKIVFGDKSAEWTPATLAALPHQTVTVINSHTKASLTYSGVPLIDLLKQLGVPGKPMGKQLRLYLVAQGSDGYEAVYSLAEVTPELHNTTVIVADTLGGNPPTSGQGTPSACEYRRQGARPLRAKPGSYPCADGGVIERLLT